MIRKYRDHGYYSTHNKQDTSDKLSINQANNTSYFV